jgi:hypothetical protein
LAAKEAPRCIKATRLQKLLLNGACRFNLHAWVKELLCCEAEMSTVNDARKN